MIGGIELVGKNLPDHFFTQLIRIPSLYYDAPGDMNNISEIKYIPFVKVIQIAYNIGQYSYEISKGTQDKTIVEFFNKHSLNRIETYVDIKCLSKL